MKNKEVERKEEEEEEVGGGGQISGKAVTEKKAGEAGEEKGTVQGENRGR